MKIGFDREKYLSLQSEHIEARRKQFGGKLYLEFGGKLFDDMHASRVLPGFTPDNKIAMLETIADEVEVVIAISATDLARNKERADLGIGYDADVLRLIDAFRSYGLFVGSVVITKMTEDNRIAKAFKRKLERLGLKVYRHYPIKGYPNDVATIVSEHGYGRNEYVETTRDLIIVTAPGPGSGKMATCLSQLYHDHQRGLASGYAKFETFPIWNLPLDHPVNVAYEAATADLDDVNIIDPFHLSAYGQQVVNYNRDVEIFPVLNVLFERLMGQSPYKSPTDMGVNMAGYCISDDDACREASKQEVIRRYYKALVEERREELEPSASERVAILMGKLGIKPEDRPVVRPALDLEKRTKAPAAAIQLPDGRIVTGKTSALLGSCSAMLLDALKALAGIDPAVKLLAEESIVPIQTLKTQHLGSRNPRLHTDEVLIALSVSATTDANARAALAQLHELRGCDVHTTVILGSVDEGIFRSLGVHVTSEPVYQSKKLYRKR
ncbi:DUF1846 domain-containing protein [Propioniciclava tarda]|uniref:UPF0371 protein ET996_03000 n=1 Tax=Propioniciclava tarda TaxID=433330 RepID=A0A4Q9KNR9_PROTD|nr:DUF1846 domain-containing protein [Propioniciclava tarda]TBT95955.1 DUF1846 domain-containing protein [Propioniciclava tarda]SMO41909.1 Uncharacterized protein, UPF0371 family [Propioniciclava tarda]HOA87934.1 DUF1846 domain-containing protein [Propioniciclava tarda]HQA30054.1 DUF1846 domain-containing protein [Propioniciclava tarda]HQD59837.1 DUF1846 domain-containing protein [Propioniciclava tarda]